MDGRLFLVRHLLILKEMTAGLDLGRRVGRKEWGGITGKVLIVIFRKLGELTLMCWKTS